MNTSNKTNVEIYLDWTNNWLTTSAMADHYNMEQKELEEIIDKGRNEHEEAVAKFKGKKVEIETYTLPAHWACPLINGDYSGLSDEDEQELKEWLERSNVGPCLGLANYEQEPEFKHRNDAGTLACDTLEFNFMKPTEK